MADNFNIHDWNRKRLIENLPENNNISEYEVEYWKLTSDGYDNRYITVKASSEDEAIEKAKQQVKFGSDFRISKSPVNEQEQDPIDTIVMDVPLFIRLLEYSREDAEDDIDLHDLAEKAIEGTKQQGILSMDDYENLINQNLDPIQETVKFITENLQGFSKYFPGGKTKGLTNDELSTILMNIVKDIEKDGKQLDESTLCKRGQDYIKARKAAGEKSSAYLSGRAVKVCKGDIKFKGKKVDSYK